MSPRLIIAAQTGILMGLVGLAIYQARELREARRYLNAASQAPPELPLSTNSRPLRLRLQSLPPINIKTEVRELDWSSVESPDYATYITNLHRIGCPEETIRDIILADINKLYAERRRSLPDAGDDWEYWRHPDERGETGTTSPAELEQEMALGQLERERRALIASLLGESATRAQLEDLSAEAMQDRDLRFLEPTKRKAMADAIARWRLALDEAGAAIDAEEADMLREDAARALNQTLGETLSPAEREQYDLRSSPLAEELREQLRGFGASREEFEQLFRLERQASQERSHLLESANSLPESQRDDLLEAARLEQEAQVRELLGPQRFADLQRSNDADYQTLFSLARDHDVPTEVANQVWGMRHEVETQTERIRQNPLLTTEQKALALRAIRSETQAAIVDVLGEPLLRDYQREGGGWLLDLTEPSNLGESGLTITPPPLPEIPANRPQQAGAFPRP